MTGFQKHQEGKFQCARTFQALSCSLVSHWSNQVTWLSSDSRDSKIYSNPSVVWLFLFIGLLKIMLAISAPGLLKKGIATYCRVCLCICMYVCMYVCICVLVSLSYPTFSLIIWSQWWKAILVLLHTSCKTLESVLSLFIPQFFHCLMGLRIVCFPIGLRIEWVNNCKAWKNAWNTGYTQ